MRSLIDQFPLICFCLLLPAGCVKAELKSALNERILTALEEINDLANCNSKSTLDQVRQQVGNRLVEFTSPIDLSRLALMSDALFFPGAIDDEPVDRYFEAAFWWSLDTLSQRHDPESIRAMEALQDRLHLDGGTALRFHRLLSRQKVRE